MVSHKKIENLLQLAIGLVIIVLVNQLINRFPYRIDLTEEKRYTISNATIDLLEKLDEPVFVEVYLAGELPNSFKRLKKAVEETLEQFDYHAAQGIEFTFKDPSVAASNRSRNEYYRTLMDKGLKATNLTYTEDGNKTEKLIFPGAIISAYGKERAVTLLKGNQARSSEERLNQSIEGLEYEIANIIRIIASDRRKRIGMIKGHNEPDSLQLAGLNNALLEKYDVFNVDLPRRATGLDFYDAIIFPKPTTKFSDKEKYQIDQYIMNGGKALFFIDALRVNMDSAQGDGTYAFPYELNIQDMLFKYGVRINRNFIQDISSGNFPVVAGQIGDQPQIRMLPWPFFPLVNNYGDHSIVKNLDATLMKFASTIDTVRAQGIKKTALLKSSPYSKVKAAPVRVSFNDLQQDLDPALYTSGAQPLAYLLEGEFASLYKNRLIPKGIDKTGYLDTSIPTSILVCGDGDMIRNDFRQDAGEPLELGVDGFTQVTYANKDFVMNALEYMLNSKGLITSKARSIQIRPLDKVKIKDQKLIWQVLNLALPIVLLVLFGILKYMIRKRKYANFKSN